MIDNIRMDGANDFSYWLGSDDFGESKIVQTIVFEYCLFKDIFKFKFYYSYVATNSLKTIFIKTMLKSLKSIK
jgi:hypothetical protein